MTFWHNNSVLESPAPEGLRQFILEWREQWATGTPEFEHYEHELHQQIGGIKASARWNCELGSSGAVGHRGRPERGLSW